DLVTANAGNAFNGPSVSVLRGDGTGHFEEVAPAARPPVGNEPEDVLVGDFNRDGRLDLAVANSNIDLDGGNPTTGDISVIFGVGTCPCARAVGDLDGDGRADVAAASNGSSGTVTVLFGLGNGALRPQVPAGVGADPEAVVRADFNNDGRADLATANQRSGDV